MLIASLTHGLPTCHTKYARHLNELCRNNIYVSLGKLLNHTHDTDKNLKFWGNITAEILRAKMLKVYPLEVVYLAISLMVVWYRVTENTVGKGPESYGHDN